ncbi:hypothetical protein A9X00_07085 [Mycobacterium sp. 1245805.9]|nr:hypothetical protein A9X00_07085 [Mycobacterium sp. 1245805.9]
MLAAITQLDKAYAEWVTAAASNPSDPTNPTVDVPLHGALRAYNQAVQMLHIGLLRNAATRYREQLTEFYLMYGQPRDPLDTARNVPTLQELNDEHIRLSEKLRDYERT